MDENQSATSSPAEPSIPKSRLDEMIQRNRELEQQNRFVTSQLTELVTRQRRESQPAAAESPEMLRLKEENPVVYNELKASRAQNRQLTGALFKSFDRQDRLEFVQEHGKEGKTRLAEVEQILENERQRTQGRTEATRSGIYMWLLGQEKLRGETRRPAQPNNTDSVAAAPGEGETFEAPPSDPRAATTVAPGTASRSGKPLTIEEEEAALAHITF